ncbi:CBS domain-containing protein [Methanocaldococcus indicus]|uniref:CBS domain-containing protein n=1 Tax=Methanocaldococcus indicus TaxID=213231 RepID=UPI003C6D9D4B
MRALDVVKGKKLVLIPPTTTIRKALIIMNNNQFRRLPVANPGSKKLEGIITAMDIVNFIGGGDKYNLIREKHNRNFYHAINDKVKEIMTKDVVTLSENADIDEAIETFLEKNVGGVPIVNKDNKILGVITERDVIKTLIDKIDEDTTIDKYTTKKVICATPGERLKDVARTMVRNKFRRLPVVREEKLVGIITTTDFIKLLGSDWAFEKLKTGNVREITNVRMEEIMAKNVITTNEEAKLKDVAKIMIEKNVGAIPVVDDDNKLIGIITEKDVIRYFAE